MSDYISREELLKHQYRIDDSASLSTRDVVNVEDIEDCPPADVRENIHGHIMETHFSDYELFKCSECGRRFFMQKSYGIYKACPFCMAIFDNEVDMRGET